MNLTADQRTIGLIIQYCLRGRSKHHLSFEEISRKLGLFTSESEDKALIQSLLDIMQDNEADSTLTFRGLCEAALSLEREGLLRHLFKDAGTYDKWDTNWRVHLSLEAKTPEEHVELMHQKNPTVIPRNHRIEQVI